jgi:hypothetical protein
MSTDDIKHFLVIHDVTAGRTDVREFGDDYDAAQQAYARVEWETLEDRSIEAVLLSSDSLETIKRTHSSWFGQRESFESLLPPGVLRAG